MNVEQSTVTSRSSSVTLRPRNRYQAHENEDHGHRHDSPLAPTPKRTSSISPLRGVSSIPTKYPSRTSAANRESEGARNSRIRPPNLFGSRSPTTLATGLWGTSWSSLQGLASNLLGSEHSRLQSPSGSKRQPLSATRGSNAPVLSGQWGPAGTGERTIGAGTKEDRILQVQAKRRQALLQANGHLNFDGAGRFKRRDSDDMNATSAPPGQSEDRDTLVYVHKVKPEDTLAGILIKYNCPAPIFNKANRLWPNDKIQIRKVVFLPIDACGVKGHRLSDDEVSGNGLSSPFSEDTMQTPTDIFAPRKTSPDPSSPRRIPIQSNPTSPSISVTTCDEASYVHDSWVSLPNFPLAVEVARLSRRSLGYFPPSRRKSLSFSDLDTPSASLDLLRTEPRNSSGKRERSDVSRSSTSTRHFMESLRGPGGVGTMGREVATPGPAQDGLNKLFASHLPNVAPRSSFESMHSNSSTGIENVGGKIEGWMRKMATKAKESVQPANRGEGDLQGDLIELSEGLEEVEHGEFRGRSGRGVDADPSSHPAIDQERILSERFPPRGRVFVSPSGT
ncbi:MAG: hypothetical protein Q9191_002814 [Dirinaria sp. TL-2023a]